MKLEASVDEQGALSATLPKSLFGKRVLISIQAIPEKPVKPNTILDIFAEADTLKFPRRTHEEILKELYALRTSE